MTTRPTPTQHRAATDLLALSNRSSRNRFPIILGGSICK
jgi:hypothetical protein